MKVFFDGEELTLTGAGPSKEDVLTSAKEAAAKKGMLVVSIEVDGTELDEEGFLALTGGVEARFSGRPVREFLAETLSDAAGYQKRLAGGLEGAADRLESDKTREGLELVGQAAEGIGWILNVGGNSRILLGLQDCEGARGIDGLGEALAPELEKASSLMEEGKHLELAYTIRAGILPHIENLGGFIAAMEEMVAGPVQ